MDTTQAPVPVQAPDQPAKFQLAPGVAVRVTLVPEVYASVQSAPQLMPAGELVTVPVPEMETVRANIVVLVVHSTTLLKALDPPALEALTL